MRYDSKVYLIHKKTGKYDPKTGNYADDIITESKRMASVTDAGTNETTVIYGEFIKGVKVVRLQGAVGKDYTMIRIGAVFYNIDAVKNFRNKSTLYITEVN